MKRLIGIIITLSVIILASASTVFAKSNANNLDCSLAPTVITYLSDVRYAFDHKENGGLPGAVLTAAVAMQDMGYSTSDIWEAYHCAMGNTTEDCWYKDFGWVVKNFRDFSQHYCGTGKITTATPEPTPEPTPLPIKATKK